MVLTGIIEQENKNIGIEICINSNILQMIRKISHDILLFLKIIQDIINIKDKNIKIDEIFLTGKLIQDIVINNNFKINYLKQFHFYLEIILTKQYLDAIKNIYLITNKFNNNFILLNNLKYSIDIKDNKIKLKTNYKHKNIIIHFNNCYLNQYLEKIYLQISNELPLGNIIISKKFIHEYQSKLLKKPIDIQYFYVINNLLKNFENNQIDTIIDLCHLLFIETQNFIENDFIVRNISFLKFLCPICYHEPKKNENILSNKIILSHDNKTYNKNFFITICKNKHKICIDCFIELLANKIIKCPECRENISFQYQKKNYTNNIDFFKNKNKNIKFYNF